MSIIYADRRDMTVELAKAIAFSNCGKDDKAEEHGRRLVHLLIATGILRDPLEV